MRKLKNHWIFLPACLLTAFALPACAADGEEPASAPDVTTLTCAALNPVSDETCKRRYGMHLLTEEDTQRYRDLVGHTTRLCWGEDALSDIVWYTPGSCFAGDRTLDDTIVLIQNRMQLYMTENM